MFALAALLLVNLALQPAQPDALALHESVDNVVRLATPDFSGQDAIGFETGEPALVGGRIAQGDALIWDLQYSKGYSVMIYVACQKRPLMLEATVKTAQGEVVASADGVGVTQVLSFVPEPNRMYALEVYADTSDSVRSTQVAAIIAQVGTGVGQKPNVFGSLVRDVTASLDDIQSMGSSQFRVGKNLYATLLNPKQKSGPEVGFFEEFQASATASVLGNTSTWTTELLDGAGSQASVGTKNVFPKPKGGQATGLLLNTQRDLEFATVRTTNTGAKLATFMVGLIRD